MGKYDDIINMSHHVSKRHPQMSLEARSAQFAPFAALVGYEEQVSETERLTCNKIELSEDERNILDNKLQEILEHIEEEPSALITYFVSDVFKEGGSYITKNCNIKRIDNINNFIILSDKSTIKFNDILEIEKI